MKSSIHVSAAVNVYVSDRAARHEIEPITAQSIRYNLRGFAAVIGDPQMSELGADHIEAWQRTTMAPSTMRTRASQIRAFCSWAVRRGLLAKDPTGEMKRRRQPRQVPRGLKPAEVRAVLSVCPDARSRLVVLLMVQEGLRRKEVAELEVGDIDADEHVALVRGKGGHERVLPLSDETREALARYLAECPALAGPLVRSMTDGRSSLAPITVGRMVSALMTAAGVKKRAYDGRSAHALRHTAATDILRSGAHLRDVQAALGHRSLATTERYLAWEVKGLREAMGGRRYASAS